MNKNKKPKRKIRTKGKSYSLKDSPFYKLSSKKKLAELLKCSVSSLNSLGSNRHFKVFNQQSESGKIRQIQTPTNFLENIHTRVASLLSRIKIPINIHSGRKGHSHVSNALEHIGTKKVLTTDIQSFFPSTSYEMVFRLFFHTFKMPGDVASLLANICCYKTHLPTGSRLSMPLAYWANHKMFEELQSLANGRNVKLSVYVDDLTFSGDSISKLFVNTVKKIVEKHGHSIHPKKTKIYLEDQVKIVTGVAIDGDEIKLKNKQHQKIYEDIQQWKLVKDMEVPDTLERRLIGRLSAASQISPKFRDKVRSIQNSQ